MINELDDKYLVLKRSDIEKYIDNANKRKLKIMIDKMNQARHQDSKKVDKKYVIVSENMKCYNSVKDQVLDEINEVEKRFKELKEKMSPESQTRARQKTDAMLQKKVAPKKVTPKKVTPKKVTPKKVTTKKKVTTNVKNKD